MTNLFRRHREDRERTEAAQARTLATLAALGIDPDVPRLCDRGHETLPRDAYTSATWGRPECRECIKARRLAKRRRRKQQ